MRKVKQILRLKFELAMSNRAISRACNVGRETVRDYLIRFQSCGLTWAKVAQMDEASVEKLLFPGPSDKGGGKKKVAPCWRFIHEEMKKKGVTLRLLWEEYLQSVLQSLQAMDKEAVASNGSELQGWRACLRGLCGE